MIAWRRIAVALAGILILASAVSASAQAVLQAGWTQQSPLTVPPGRAAAGMAYDSATAQLVMFGGGGSTFLNDTWAWNGTDWTNVTPASGNPAARSNMSMAYDAAANQVVMFGGNANVPGNNVTFGDTWLWNGTSWAQASPGTSPSARSSAFMGYDAATQQMVLFGGADTNGNLLNDTWVWDGTTWSQVSPSAKPSAREGSNLAWDAALGELILFGGFDGNYRNDLWAWNGTSWTQLSVANNPPSGRYGAAMEYDATLGQLVMFGGANGSGWVGDTWVITGTTNNNVAWTQETGPGPSARNVSAIAWDAAQGAVVLFGGENTSGSPSDTWTWAGDPQNFGNVNVCASGQSTPAPCSNIQALTYNVPLTATVGSVQVVTQGAAGLDFTMPSYNCAISPGVYTCSVNVQFAPRAPGLRTGAVKLIDSGGNLLATTLIYGIGQGPVVAISPGTQTTVGSGLANPYSIAVDAAGNTFIADYGNGRVVKVPAGGGAQTTIASGYGNLEGVAVDGAGNVYTAEIGSNLVLEFPAGGGTPITVGSGLNRPAGVAVDGVGNVFIADYQNDRVVEVPAGGGQQTTVGSGLNQPQGVAVDGLGDVIIADSGNNRVVRVTRSGVQSTLPLTGLNDPIGVAADAAGDVFVANYWISSVYEITPGGVQTTLPVTGLGGNILGVGLDAAGDIFIADFDNNRVVELNLSQSPVLNFGSVNVGARSAGIGITVQNVGNQILTGTLGPTSTANFAEDLVNSTCTGSNGISLSPGGSCIEAFYAQPTTAGPLSDSAVVTDNSFNASSAMQTINLAATGMSLGYTLTVTPMGAGAGTVTSLDALINCSIANGSVTGTCSAIYSTATNVSLQEAAAAGSTLQAWGGACSGTYFFCSVNVGSTTTVTASFNPVYFAVTAPTTALNVTSAVGTATVNFTGSGILGAIAVVTQGAVGKDFNVAAGGTCAVGASYSIAQTCTVNYTFTPLAPGARKGAVLLTDSSGNVLGTTYLSGIGTGPQGLFDTTPQSLSISGLAVPRGLSLDANGNLYAFETCSGTCNGQLDEFLAGTSTKVQLASLPDTLYTAATAVDGAGNVFVTTNQGSGNQGILYELIGGKAPAVQVTTIPDADNNLAIDGAGNLFFAGYGNGNEAAIYELPAGSNQVITLVPSGTSLNRRFIGMATDAAGNLFAADYNNNILYELPAGATTLVTVASGGYLSGPAGVAVDPAGNIYVTNDNGTAVIRYAAGTYAATLLPEAGQRGIALDSAGNIYTITSDSTIAGYTRTQASPITFASTAVGNTSNSLQGDLFENDGNATLNVTGYSASVPFAPGGPLNTCATGGMGSSVSCVVGATFTPTAGGTVGGTVIIADNNLGVSGTQTISLSGTGVATNYTLTVAPIGSGAGTVTDNLSAISCTWSNGNSGGTCAGGYQSGASVTLTANASPGSIFLGWGGACAGFAPTCQISMIQAFNVTASFAQQNFGTPNVCPPGQTIPAPCSTSIPVTINIPITTNIGAIQVVTQGVTGLDFSLANAGTCTGTVAGGTACTLNVNFAPLAPGSRLGAVEVYDTGGAPVVTVPIYGIGQGPASAFSPSKAIPINTGNFALDYPAGLLVDAVGNLFIAEGDVTNQVLKIAPDGSITQLPFTFALPQGMAEDGAGDLFVANNNLNEVIEIPAGCTNSGCQVVLASNLRSQLGVAVDGVGDVFVGDYLDGEVVEIPAGCSSTACQQVRYNKGTSGARVVGLTADAVGNLYIADAGLQVVAALPPGCNGGKCEAHIGLGLNQPVGVAVDAAGDIFIADQGLQQVIEEPANCLNSACQTVLLSGITAAAVAVDSSGNLVVDNVAANQYQVLEIPRSLPPSLNFALTNVGSASTDSPQSVTIQNVGNQVLTGGLSLQNSQDFVNYQQTATCSQFNLAPGGVCTQAFSFTPTTTGVLTDTRTFADNSMNIAVSVSAQAVNLSGIGTSNSASGTVVPNVVGMTASAAATALTSSGLTVGSVSNGYSSSEPQGSVSGESPAAGSPVNLGSAINLMVASGQAPAPTANPLTLENNYFVTGDVASGGVTLKGAAASNGMVSGTITIPDLTSCNCSQGVPDGADIVDGFLYWTTLESPGSTASGNTGTFLGYPIVGQQVGVDVPNYYDGTTTGTLRVYRADVNGYFQVHPKWNGERLGSGSFAVSLPAGTSGFPITEGASLVVIYRALSLSVPLKSVVIYDGSVVPAASATQTVQGFYDAAGGTNGELTTLSAGGASWNGSISLAAHASQYTATLNPNTAYAALIFSTPVTNSDNDGILDAWKAGPAAPDFFAGQPGYYDVKTQSWVALPGAKHGNKDLFVQFDWMCGSVDGNGNCSGENLFPSPDVNGNDPLAMVQQAFKNAGVALHLEPGNPVAESTCSDTPNAPLCQFPNQPGVVEWKNGLEFSKLWPRNYNSCISGGDCTARFPYGQKDSYHYVLFGHSLAIPAWNTRFGTLTGISADPVAGMTTITTADRGPAQLADGSASPLYCSTRFTITGVQGLPSLNGVFAASCPNSTTIILTTPNLGIKSTWTYPNGNLPEPDIGLTSGTVTSISGYSDLGGADSAVTLALWETDPQQDMSKRAQVIAGTLLHEIGHTLGLGHGGIYYQSGSGGFVQNGNSVPLGSYIPNFDINCKPNYQSSMNYLFQLDGVGPNAAVTFSNQTLQTLTESSLGSVTNLLDVNNALATYPGSAWYSSSQPPNSSETQASRHCDGTPLNAGETGYFIDGSVAPVTPAWTANQNITFDGMPAGSTGLPGLVGYDDQANMDLRQVGATGGEFASLASVLSFGSSATPLNVLSGGTATLGAGGTVTLGAGGSLTLVNGGSVTVGSGASIKGGGSIQFGTAGSVTVTTDSTVTPGANGTIIFASGDTVTVSGVGTFTFPSGGTATLGGGGTVTLSGGGSIAVNGGGTVTIPSTGGSYDLTSGGTVTLGGGGTVTLGGGGTATLGGGGTATLGGGGTVTLGGGGTATLGGGGTVTLGGGGTATLGGGGTVTLGGGGTVTLGGGGTATLGGGGTVTLGGGGTVTLGGGGTATLGAGGTATLGAGGTATLGAGGTVTLGAGGNITMPGGGTVTLGGGGTVTLGGGGTVTLGGGGTSPITVNGVFFGTCSGSCSIPAGGTVTLGGGGTVTLGGGGSVTLGGGGTVTLGGGGTVTLGGGGVVTLGGGGAVTLGGGGTATLGGGGTATLGGGGTATLGGGGNLATELDYATADSVARPPSAPTYAMVGNSIQVNWTAPIFGVVQTYTISREVEDSSGNVIQPATVIGSVSGVGGAAPATTFTDTNPPSGTVIYTITTTLAQDPANPTQLQSAASAPAVLTVGQSIVLGPLPSSVVLGSTQPTTTNVTATAQAGGTADMQLVSFSASGPCSAGTPTMDGHGVSSATVTLTSTGACTITASQAGDSTTATTSPAYSAATPVSGTFTILPQGSNLKSQTISFGSLPSVQYGSTFSVMASSSAGQPVSLTANGPCTLTSPTGGTTSGAGLCRITATAQAGNGYTGASLTQSFNITAAPLTLTANNQTIAYGQPLLPPVLGSTYNLSGFVNGDSASGAVSGTPTLATTAPPLSGPGTYPITVSPGTLKAANYSFYFVGATVTITPATTATSVVSSSPGNASNFMQQVTFTATVVDNSPGSLGAAPTGTVSFSSNNVVIGTGTLTPLPCTTAPCASQAMVSTTTLATGSNNVTVSYSGDTNYYPSTQAGSTASGLTQTVTPVAIVSLAPASLSFGNINVGKSSSASVTLTNTGDANLTLSSVQVTGPNMGDFTATSACGSSVGYTSPSNSCTITVKFTPSETGVETATLQVTDNADNTPGSQQFVSLTGSGLSTIGGTSVYTDAIFSNSNGCGAVTVSGKSSVNSFNSALGYSSSTQNSGGNVGTNGNVTVGGGSTIYGSAATDILTTGKCSGSSVTGLTTNNGTVTGGLVALNGPVNYPAPPAPNPAPPTTSQNISGSCPGGMSGCSNTGSKAVALAPGRYGNVTANSGTTVHLSAGTYLFNSLKITANSLLHVDSGPVIVNLAGASLTGGTPVLDFTGGGMENPGGIPGNLQFTYGGSQGLNLAGGANAYAAVYAPNAPVNLNAGTDFFGSITGSTVTSSGGTSIHYDTNLPNIAQGSTIWFAAVVNNLKGLPANQQAKLYMTNGSISFTANNIQYTVPVPNAVVTLNSSISGSKSTAYDLANSRWSTTIASTNLTGNTFVTGVAFPVPVALPAGIQNVKWSASFSTDTPGITLQWQWNAQVYTQFSQTYATTTNSNVLGVNAEDGSADAFGTDPAGTPETYKPDATFGATDGYFSAASGVVPTVAQVSVSPSSLNFGTVPVTQTSSPLTAVLTNNYGSGFTISSIAVSGANSSDFTESDNCSRTAGGFTSSCTISVTFKPGYSMPEAAKIVITDTANNSPQTVYISGTGQ